MAKRNLANNKPPFSGIYGHSTIRYKIEHINVGLCDKI